MILSVSRRTDVPAFYSEWFYNRIKEQYAYVRNPMNPHQISKINLSPAVIDCIVFWSKNPQPMLANLSKLDDYPYYFQFTLNAYDNDVETYLPRLADRIATFSNLSKIVGKERIIWRYDPILCNHKYTIAWHIEQFKLLAKQLAPCTNKCTISFIDFYSKNRKRMKELSIDELSYSNKCLLAEALSTIAHSNHLRIDTCAEDIDLSKYNLEHARCIDDKLIEKLIDCSLNVKKDPNQRLECGCMSSIDLGSYNTCQHGCVYCYANHSDNEIKKSNQQYDMTVPLLCSKVQENDKITERAVMSLQNPQLRLF